MSELVVTAILRTFRSSNNNTEWEFNYNTSLKKMFFYEPLFYANGNCKENDGYVSIIFDGSFGPQKYKFCKDTAVCCHISVMNVNGRKRFTQSVMIDHSYISPLYLANRGDRWFGLERYLKRETLLNDPDELLPGDCLTVCIDFYRIFPFGKRTSEDYLCNTEKAFCIGKDEISIFLDTGFGRDLCRESEVFRCASDTPFIESRTRKMPIKKEEVQFFVLILHIFNGSEELEIQSVENILRLYHVADKYNLQSVIETCRQLIRAVLRATENTKVRVQADRNVLDMLELAVKYRDNDLKDTVQTYLEIKDKFRTNDYALGKHLKEKLYTEWICDFRDVHHTFSGIYSENDMSHFYFFIMKRIPEPEFEFYK